MKLVECGGLKWTIREGTTDEKVLDEVVKRHSYTRRDFTIEQGERWVDLGANIGAFCIPAAARGAFVVAVEPEPENLHYLAANIRLNGLEERITVIPAAVTLDGAPVTLYTCKSARNKYRHTLTPKKNWTPISVAGTAFASLMAAHPDGVKMDIEGAELPILDATESWTPQKLAFEYHFDFDRSIPAFLRRMERLRKDFSDLRYGKLPPGDTYDFFPSAKIVLAQKGA